MATAQKIVFYPIFLHVESSLLSYSRYSTCLLVATSVEFPSRQSVNQVLYFSQLRRGN